MSHIILGLAVVLLALVQVRQTRQLGHLLDRIEELEDTRVYEITYGGPEITLPPDVEPGEALSDLTAPQRAWKRGDPQR